MALTKVSGSVLKNPLSLSGNVSVGGTLTYEDVTNVDAIGIITARAGLNVSGGTGTFAGDVSIADKIIHTGDTNTAIRFPAADTISLETAGNEILRTNASGQLLVGSTGNSTGGIAEFSKSVGGGAGGCHISVENTSTNSVNNTAGIHLKTDTGTAKFFKYSANQTFIQSAAGGASELILQASGAHPVRLYTNGNERLRINSSGAFGLGGATYGSSGQVLTSAGSGSVPTWTTISGTTINGNVDDYIITASGTANTLNGESSLLYTGSRMGINCSGGSITDVPATSHDTVVVGNSSMASGGICLEGSSGSGNLGFQMYKQGSFLAARMLYERSSNELQFHSATGSAPGSGESVKLKLKPGGNVEIVDGDLLLASGHGIDFGATANGGTGTPNEVLDDYEEGSWTPAIEGLSNTPSFHNLGGTYTKIGNRVWIQCHIQINGSNKPQFSNQSNAFKISGLPFTGQGTNGTGYFGAHGVCVWQQLQWVGGSYSSYGHGDDTQLSPGIVDSGTRITLQTCGQGIYYTGQLLNRALHNNYAPNIEFDMSYRTAT